MDNQSLGFGGKGGTRTLDPGIMRAMQPPLTAHSGGLGGLKRVSQAPAGGKCGTESPTGPTLAPYGLTSPTSATCGRIYKSAARIASYAHPAPCGHKAWTCLRRQRTSPTPARPLCLHFRRHP